jgi:hypothetical protein
MDWVKAGSHRLELATPVTGWKQQRSNHTPPVNMHTFSFFFQVTHQID